MSASQIHVLIASLMGLSGVALLAAGAHVNAASSVQTAGQFLLFHAPVIMAVTALRKAGLVHDLAASLSLAALILGLVLFSGDLALRGLKGQSLFAYAAPAGGIFTMAGWAGLAVAALLPKSA
ncbi:MAG: DUF423 domain-containing protein [Beijerinckiaceae bacterium]|nr:DUF423 domain-containing protein [Beijerinckiaceae bacterium]